MKYIRNTEPLSVGESWRRCEGNGPGGGRTMGCCNGKKEKGADSAGATLLIMHFLKSRIS